jgi:AraC-like DNA-binding protein
MPQLHGLPSCHPRATLSPFDPKLAASDRWLLSLDVSGGSVPLDHPDVPPFLPSLTSAGAPWADLLRLELHQPTPAPSPGHEILVLGLGPAFMHAAAGRTARSDTPVELPLPADDPIVRYLALALWAELRAGCPSGRPFGEAIAVALAARLSRYRTATPSGLAACRGGLSPARLRRVLDHIEAQLGGDTSLQRLAAIAGLSPHHFATAFRRSTGVPPHRYVLERRIERAKELLAGPRRPLAEVAYALGFPNQPHFTTVFRRLVGITPGAYRNGR